MAVCKIKKFNPSYFSVYTILDSDTKTGTGYYDTFDQDNYSSTAFTSSSVGTSNITFDPTNGRFTVAESGNYLVFYSICAQLEAASSAFVQGRIDVNGSEVYESTQLYANSAIEPRDYLFSHILQLSAGQYLNFASKQTSGTPATAGLIHEKGSYVSIFRIQNDYGQIVYNANGNFNSNDKTMGGSSDTSSEISSSNNVDYDSSNGRFTVNADKKFLLFANVLTNINSVGADSNMLQTINFSKNGSEIADAGAEIRQGSDPYQSAYSLIEDFQATQYMQTDIEGDGVNPFQIMSGSTTGIFDISYDANEPGAYLSFTCDSDSQTLSSLTDYNCFDETNWSALSIVEFIPTTNITFTKSDGRFTFDRAGKYFIVSQIVIDGGGNGKREFFLKKNGIKVYTSRFHLADNWLPREKSYCLIIDVAVDDYIEIGFQSTQVNDFFKQDSTISIFKIDSGTPALDLESRGLEVTAESTPQAQIADDFDLKTFDIDTLTPQRSRLTDQVPFVLGVPGPLSLRGRCFGGTEEPPIVKPGDKKN